jgi:hypothetical protein
MSVKSLNGKSPMPFFASACGSPLNENAQYKLKQTALAAFG